MEMKLCQFGSILIVFCFLKTATSDVRNSNPQDESAHPKLDLSGGRYSYKVVTNSELLNFGNPSHCDEILLNDNKISRIEDISFVGFQNLKKLSVVNNLITTIQSYSFSGLEKLKILELSNNLLANVNSIWLKDLISLERLYLQGNEISVIQEGIFQRNQNLKSIDLSRNKIASVGGEVFNDLRNLTRLKLDHNEILSLGSYIFTGTNLLTLHLNDNSIMSIDRETFSGLDILFELNLSNNLISEFQSGTFRETSNLAVLRLSSNPFKEDFAKNITVPALKVLISRNTGMKNIDFVDKLKKLDHIDLANNFIRVLNEGVFHSHSKLVVVNLQDNAISGLDQTLLEGLFSPNGKYVLIVSNNSGVCKNCSEIDCEGQLALQEFLCEDPDDVTGHQGVFHWQDRSRNVTVKLVTSKHDLDYWLLYHF